MSTDLKGKSILVVDDFPQITVTVSAMLRDAGCSDIDSAKTGEQALQMLSNQRYDVVICDYHLGDGKDGRQVLEEAHFAGTLGYATAFLMVTGENNLPIVMGAIEHRPDDYLVKPFVKEVLLHRIDKLLKRKQDLTAIDTAIDDHNYTLAIALADREIRQNPANTYDLLKLKAELSLRAGRAEQAKQLYEQILQRRPILWARLGLAKTNLMLGECATACDQFRALVDENKYYIEAYDGLAEALECVAERVAAQDVLAQAVALSPTSGRRQLRLAQLAEQNHDTETLIKALRSSVRFNKKSVFRSIKPHLRLAELLTEQGANLKAIRALSEAREEFQNQPNETVQLAIAQAQLYRLTNNHDAAQAALRDAMAKFSSHGLKMGIDVLPMLLESCFALDHPDFARQVAAQLVSHYHDDPHVLQTVQQLFDRAGRGQEGSDLIRDQSREIIAMNNEGVRLFQAGDSEAAMAHFEEAANALPLNRTINLNAAKALMSHMRRHGKDAELMRRTRHYLQRAKPTQAAETGYNDALAMFETLQSSDIK